MWIFAGVLWGGGVKRQTGCRQRRFSAFLLVISSKTLRIRPALLNADTHSFVGFSVIPKCVSVSDPEYFALNSVFVPVCLASDRATFENNSVKTSKDRHTVNSVNLRRGL